MPDIFIGIFVVWVILLILLILAYTKHRKTEKAYKLEYEKWYLEEVQRQKDEAAQKLKFEIIKRKEEESKRKAIEATQQADFERQFLDFSNSDDYILLESFAAKNEDLVVEGVINVKNLEENLTLIREIKNFKTLLKNKKWNFSDNELIKAIDKANINRHFKDVEKKVLRSNPQSKSDFIISYLDYYRSDDKRKLTGLKILLGKRNLLEDTDSLENYIIKVEKEIELENLERRLREANKKISLEKVDKFSGYKFEEFLSTLFSKRGYQVEQTRLSRDQGADLVIVKFGEKSVIQAKRCKGKVGNRAVQEIMAAISLYQAQKGVVITNNYFTRDAIELANANDIELIDRDALEKLIFKYW